MEITNKLTLAELIAERDAIIKAAHERKVEEKLHANKLSRISQTAYAIARRNIPNAEIKRELWFSLNGRSFCCSKDKDIIEADLGIPLDPQLVQTN